MAVPASSRPSPVNPSPTKNPEHQRSGEVHDQRAEREVRSESRCDKAIDQESEQRPEPADHPYRDPNERAHVTVLTRRTNDVARCTLP